MNSTVVTSPTADIHAALAQAARPQPSRWAQRLGWGLLLVVSGFALLGPWLISADPDRQDLLNALAPLGGHDWLGTDPYGRSMLARLAHGAQLSFLLALLTTLMAVVPGVLLGIVAAWRGGWLEKALVALADMIMALPGLLLVLLVIAFAPGHFVPLCLGLALALWVEFFRISRARSAVILQQPYIEATRMLGFGPGYILRRLLLPALAPTLLTLASFAMSTAIIGISTLSAISVGVRPPTAELGSMIVELLPYYAEAPALVLLPSLLIFLLVLALQLISGGRKS